MNNRLSIVFPIYNEVEVLPILRKELDSHFKDSDSDIEFLFVDDGSTDASKEILEDWKKTDERVRILSMGTNHGHQKAMQEGLRKANGDWILTMDADLQDPPNVIDFMLKKANEGYDIIHARRASREGEPFLRKMLAWSYYRLVKYLFVSDLLLDVGDFRMMSKKSVDEYFKQFPNSKMLRADIPKIDLKQCTISYDRHKRAMGKSKFTFRKLLDLAVSFRKSGKDSR